MIRELGGKFLTQKIQEVWVSRRDRGVQETHLPEALLQCNNYTQRQVPLGSVNTMMKREQENVPEGDSEKQQLLGHSNMAIPKLPSGETPLPLCWVCRESPCLHTRARMPHLIYLRASSVDGGNEELDWGMWRSVPGRWVLEQLWRIARSRKLWVALHMHRAGKSHTKRSSMLAQIKDRYSSLGYSCRKGYGISLWELCIVGSQF